MYIEDKGRGSEGREGEGKKGWGGGREGRQKGEGEREEARAWKG